MAAMAQRRIGKKWRASISAYENICWRGGSNIGVARSRSGGASAAA